MARSQNGYTANDRTLVSSRRVPGTSRNLTVRNGPTGDLLLWIAAQFDALVEDIEQGILDDWGYAERPIRGGTELSNHASGTAIDLNATSHPLGTQPAANFTRDEIATIRAIVARTEGCVRWGGDYSGRKDSMHFEINAPEAACKRVLDKLNAAPGGVGEEDELNDKERLQLARIHEQLMGTMDPKQGWPGFPSLEYPWVKSTPVDFIRAMDQNVIRMNRAIAAIGSNIAKISGVDPKELAAALLPDVLATIKEQLADVDTLDEDAVADKLAANLAGRLAQ